MKKSEIWQIVVVVLILAFLASGIWENPISKGARVIVGNVQKYWTPPTIQTDVPTLTQDEVCALVYNYLEDRASSVVLSTYIRQPLFTALSEARPYFAASYRRNGKWQVSALGYGPKDKFNDWFFYYNGGLWNLYETSKTIEPANDQATALLFYIQQHTR